MTQTDCLVYINVVPGTQTSFFGQTLGQGCVYPAATKTMADQLTANGLTWKAYMQDIGIGSRAGVLSSILPTTRWPRASAISTPRGTIPSSIFSRCSTPAIA